jgi:hypothetical protein
MKVIQPINIWNNGIQNQAVYFDLVCKNDNLADSATFYYYLYSATMELLASVGGNQPALVMKGLVYDGWETNEYAYDWGANQLNITIIGDYTTTTTTTSTTTALPTTTSTTTSSTTEQPTNTSTTTTTTTENLLTSTTTSTTTKS